jgi:hypothetical protein
MENRARLFDTHESFTISGGHYEGTLQKINPRILII